MCIHAVALKTLAIHFVVQNQLWCNNVAILISYTYNMFNAKCMYSSCVSEIEIEFSVYLSRVSSRCVVRVVV
jgi:hypothetical protein